MPTFIERNGGIIPSDEIQLSLPKIEYFGVSLFKSCDNLIDHIKTIPALRRQGYFDAVGNIDKNKGVVSSTDSKGNFQYYLYSPFNNNPYVDFTEVIEEDNNE